MNEWIIVAIVAVVLLFSAKKLPDMARGLGQSMRIFKAETRGMRDDDAQASSSHPSAGTSQPGSGALPPPGEVAPGRVAGPVDAGTNTAAQTTQTTQNGASGAEGAPRPGA